MKLVIEPVPEFEKDITKLSKKYKNLKKDLDTALKVLQVEPTNESRSKRISGLGENVVAPIYKLRKFYSEDFKGKGSSSGFRLIYAFINDKIILIEIYHKNKQEVEDRERIKKYFSSKSNNCLIKK
ncbi:MAG: hypothetical protein APG12_00234 [Candidatus Methanofastidiosum methylothiophilum]|uniref:Toxin HigB-2 n=1 Tax=Candidatus Methanofastidiosum methylothiophilum TaxID=1705564 RepID=A0A150J2D8_9EURY|nr:MAG: hypothetical protein APG10_01182 [Candidatus Methanofastidiosum methylthiophilus]KYC48522.1 MAG: hypothetical protein APG11_00192 [Candidatus Methanofastidiosum methylthiophilus]KYC51308.1 MAG: hypothetical protein APG12_00234 [Candidatus Methanofastidiosum methylthiophilus]